MIFRFYERYVRWTDRGASVGNATLHVGDLDEALRGFLTSGDGGIFLHARALKHVYDKRPAQECDACLSHLSETATIPDLVYEDQRGKRGNYCFVKKLEGDQYLCVLERVGIALEVVTFFVIREEKYLARRKLLWSREDGSTLHRHAPGVGYY